MTPYEALQALSAEIPFLKTFITEQVAELQERILSKPEYVCFFNAVMDNPNLVKNRELHILEIACGEDPWPALLTLAAVKAGGLSCSYLGVDIESSFIDKQKSQFEGVDTVSFATLDASQTQVLQNHAADLSPDKTFQPFDIAIMSAPHIDATNGGLQKNLEIGEQLRASGQLPKEAVDTKMQEIQEAIKIFDSFKKIFAETLPEILHEEALLNVYTVLDAEHEQLRKILNENTHFIIKASSDKNHFIQAQHTASIKALLPSNANLGKAKLVLAHNVLVKTKLPDLKGENLHTALRKITVGGDSHQLRLLLELGADPTVKDNGRFKRSAIDWAILRKEDEKLEILQKRCKPVENKLEETAENTLG